MAKPKTLQEGRNLGELVERYRKYADREISYTQLHQGAVGSKSTSDQKSAKKNSK